MSQNPFFLVENIAESVTIPHLNPLGEGLDCQGDIVRVGMP